MWLYRSLLSNVTANAWHNHTQRLLREGREVFGQSKMVFNLTTAATNQFRESIDIQQNTVSRLNEALSYSGAFDWRKCNISLKQILSFFTSCPNNPKSQRCYMGGPLLVQCGRRGWSETWILVFANLQTPWEFSAEKVRIFWSKI